MRTAVTGVALALAAVMLAGCGGSSGGIGLSGFPKGNGAALQIPDGRRGEPVALSGPTLDGGTLDLATLRGRVVVLNVWGSWCAPCRKEAPALVGARKELLTQEFRPGNTTEPVAFVGINTREDDEAQARSFQEKFKILYPSIVDKGQLLLSLRGAVPPNAIPTTLVLDPQGRIAARFSGEISQQTLVDLVNDVIGVRPAAAGTASPAATATAGATASPASTS